MAGDGVWGPATVVNAVREALEKLSENGKVPVKESDLVSYIDKVLAGINAGRTDVVKALIVLETLGYVRVASSGWRERIIIYRPRA